LYSASAADLGPDLPFPALLDNPWNKDRGSARAGKIHGKKKYDKGRRAGQGRAGQEKSEEIIIDEVGKETRWSLKNYRPVFNRERFNKDGEITPCPEQGVQMRRHETGYRY
jgi:hypothetical protein